MKVLQKVFQNFQNIAKRIAKLSQYCKKYYNTLKVLQKVLQHFQNFAISIAKFRNYSNTHCKTFEILQYLLQKFLKFAILIAKSQNIAISIENFQKYCNTLQYYWNNPCGQRNILVIIWEEVQQELR